MPTLPTLWKETAFLRGFAFAKIPLLFLARPVVQHLDSQRCQVRLPYTRRNLNHLNSMYFGALCIGADIAGGLMAQRLLDQLPKGLKGALIFKDFKANFLKRAEGDTVFTCEAGAEIQALIERCTRSGEREDIPVKVTATVPSLSGQEPVAEFILSLSIKVRKV
jgi:acyl-coenzyme A thioesterase PaaI-like protein